jgi:ABC-type multidrug transport system fused ATPase/permease subunit
MRFYDHSSGQIKIDDNQIEDYDIHYLRSIFGAVSQEPQLFDETVQYNILYNKTDESSSVVARAIRMA